MAHAFCMAIHRLQQPCATNRTRGHAVAVDGRNPLAAGQLLRINVVVPRAAGQDSSEAVGGS